MARDQYNQQALGKPLNNDVKQARILMVGAGGIGCELLKNLLLTGYGEIHIVDLDTIDLSNLNRQFLFRHEHIKKSKALVAKEVAQKFNPTVKLESYHANIKDAQFNIDWFKTFTIVFNALDNLDARRHVNKMCLAADVPLIESGTTGFNGQVQVIKKGVTACYDCTTKVTPKSYPVCTIRSTPSQPIHCIVWGKSYLLSEVFGATEIDSDEMDHSQDSENAKEIEKLRQEAQALKNIRDSMGTDEFPKLLFNKVFNEDITRLRSMEEMWTTRRKPDPLEYDTVAAAAAPLEESKETVLKIDQKPWTLEENLTVFKDSLNRLSQRMKDLKAASDGNSAEPAIIFDKDDIDTLDFVTATANIRSIIFGIETKSRFDTKQMAGNIIPAIATTNAIVAGLCVLQSFKVLRGDYSSTKEVFLSPFASERLMAYEKTRAPNPDCPVCSVAQTRLLVDLSRATLNDLVEDFLRVQLGYGEEFVVSNEAGLLYDVDETENLEKKLSELGIKDDSFLTVIDEDEEDPRVNLVLSVQGTATPTDSKPISALPTAVDSEQPISIPRRPKVVAQPAEATNGDAGHKEAVTNGEAPKESPGTAAGMKRGADELGEAGPEAKRGKLKETSDDVIVLDSADDGAIIIDDD
ncbi:hypothetical protein V495_03087 [Pseudogymnoascus sp. VKM F-4514 (FW-929)]|nr:hypothetical protein V495_03087 [Pseudogymnoascus sp. VKM F-4514 (FW-929)]KFY60889.1 hypothetical protein V497_03283 [Pseudogymnoascus sp. VKM F-4516 (FW-969)]